MVIQSDDSHLPMILPRHPSCTSPRTDTSFVLLHHTTLPPELNRACVIMLDDVVRYVLDEVAMDGSIGEFDVLGYVA